MRPSARQLIDLARDLHEAGRQSLMREGYSKTPALWEDLEAVERVAWIAVASAAFEKVQAVALPTPAIDC